MQSISQNTESRKKKTLEGSIILGELYEGELLEGIYLGEKVLQNIFLGRISWR